MFCSCYGHQTGGETGGVVSGFIPSSAAYISDCSKSVFAFDVQALAIAMLFLDQIKPIGQLVPVS